jgi:predicted short-subunit dehydrogenase-like oxidoreductase (DUF2520 family)
MRRNRPKPTVSRPRRTLGIVGPGKVGTAIAARAAGAGWRIAAMIGRSQASVDSALAQVATSPRPGTAPSALAECEIVLLTVRDDQIADCARQLAGLGAAGPGCIAAHCSGALPAGVLAPLAQTCGAALASLHPLQTFPSAAAALRKLEGTYFFCEGDRRALEVARGLIEDIGGRFRRIDSPAKPLYHAAAVMACNYLTALLDAAITLAGQAGIARGEALEALEPLVGTTVENTCALGPDEALTGPIARGDAGTVAEHLRAIGALDIETRGVLEDIYRRMGVWTLGLARRKAQADVEDLDAILRLLQQAPPEGADE